MPTVPSDFRYYIDIGPDPLFAAGSFISIYPEDLDFSGMVRGAGDCSWQISYSAVDYNGNLVVTPPPPPDYVPFIGPWRSYYRLRCGGTAIQAGVITQTSTTLGADFMSVTGKTWEGVFERWQYPFDPRISPDHTQDYQFANTFRNDETTAGGDPLGGTGLAYQCYNRDVIRVWKDIMTVIMGQPNRLQFNIAKLSGLSTIKTKYNLALGDSTTLDSLINQLAGTGEGFDWWVGHDMKIRWAAPYRFGPTSAPVLFYTLDSTDLDSGFLDTISFTNEGPEATHVLGTGAGLASQTQLGAAYGYTPAQAQFSRIDASYDFGDVRDRTQLVAKAQKALSLAIQPKHTIPVSVDPAFYPYGLESFWADWRIGRAIWIDIDMGYHIINSAQQLKSYEAHVDAEGNATVDWTLQQIYDTDPGLGTAQG